MKFYGHSMLSAVTLFDRSYITFIDCELA